MLDVKTILALLTIALGAPAADLRVGVIGTDTSHVPAFAKLLNGDPNAPDHIAGARLVAAYKGGSKDIPDSTNRVVTSSSAPVTFAITGPGTIIAVDSGSVTQETFRGNARNAYQGLAFAIVQATGAGTITVTASSGSLTAASTTIQASPGTFVPCSGTCD